MLFLGTWLLKIVLGTSLFRWILTWQLAHPSKHGWWRRARNMSSGGDRSAVDQTADRLL
jgi:hypothetical protein